MKLPNVINYNEGGGGRGNWSQEIVLAGIQVLEEKYSQVICGNLSKINPSGSNEIQLLYM